MKRTPTHAILDTSHNAFVSMAADGTIVYWNPRAEEMFGWPRSEALGRTVADTIIPERHREAHWVGLAKFLAEGEAPILGRRVELSALRRDRTEFPIEITISALREADGWSFHAFIQDIAERKAADEQRARLEMLAGTDEVTGLASRRRWEEELVRELARARRRGHGLTVGLVELDGFEDGLQAAGGSGADEVLRELAESWRLQLRLSDLIARYGEFEFAVLLPHCPPRRGLEIADRLKEAMPGGRTFSGGFAIWEPDEPAESLVLRAERALDDARRRGGDQSVEAAPLQAPD